MLSTVGSPGIIFGFQTGLSASPAPLEVRSPPAGPLEHDRRRLVPYCLVSDDRGHYAGKPRAVSFSKHRGQQNQGSEQVQNALLRRCPVPKDVQKDRPGRDVGTETQGSKLGENLEVPPLIHSCPQAPQESSPALNTMLYLSYPVSCMLSCSALLASE